MSRAGARWSAVPPRWSPSPPRRCSGWGCRGPRSRPRASSEPPGRLRYKTRVTPAPTTAAAMKAVLTDERFSDPDWIYERKLDGIRCGAIRGGGAVRLLSRHDLALNGRFPEIATALERQPCKRFAIDGEVVAFSGAETSFAKLADVRSGRSRAFFYVFDITWLDSDDVRPRPLRERKRLL